MVRNKLNFCPTLPVELRTCDDVSLVAIGPVGAESFEEALAHPRLVTHLVQNGTVKTRIGGSVGSTVSCGLVVYAGSFSSTFSVIS